MDIESRVIEQIKENFFAGMEFNLDYSQSLIESGSIDSIEMIKLVGLLENEFSVKVEPDEYLPENLDSIDAIVGYLKRKGVD